MSLSCVYVFTVDGAEWEDLIIYLTEEEAIEKSKKFPNVRLDIFVKSPKGGYYPSYNYYLNGVYVKAS
jgi:hypothetical protein